MPLFIWVLLAWDAVTGRQSVSRTPEAQARVDRETSRLALFHFQSCPYCRRTRRDIRLLGLDIRAFDIERDPSKREELVRGGGKKQVPCLRIEEPDGSFRWLYESRDIARYLYDRFAATPG